MNDRAKAEGEVPTLRITAEEGGLRLHGSAAPLLPCLRAALRADTGPITVMIHGYKYQPGHPAHCPHQSLFALAPRITGPRIVSWPRRLGLRGQQGEGLGLCFGWAARGSIWQAFHKAEQAGRHLGHLLDMLRRLAPQRPVALVAHSLGARVALTAIAGASPGTVQRVVLLAGAEYRDTARRALLAPGGVGCEVLNVTSRENDLYDFLFERLVHPPTRGDRVLGSGGLSLPNEVTVQLDSADCLRALRSLGYPVAAPQRRICHWSPYLRPGVFPLYRGFLAGRLPLPLLHATLPAECAPRWSRLRPGSGWPTAQGFVAKPG